MNQQENLLAAVLAEHLRTHAEQPFLISAQSGEQLTFQQLAWCVRWLEEQLISQGIIPGDTVALMLPGGADTALISLTLLLAGFVVTPLNLLNSDDRLSGIIEHCQARAVICSSELSPRWSVLNGKLTTPSAIEVLFYQQDLPLLALSQASKLVQQPALGSKIAGSPRPSGLLMYTSGTTGLPKGILLSPHHILAATQQITLWHQLTADDRLLCALPYYHINGQIIGLLTPFVSGGSLVSAGHFSVSQWWHWAAKFQVSWLNMVPTMVAFLLNSSGQPSLACHIRFTRTASAPLPARHYQQFEQRFAIPIIEGMGMTECASLAFCNPHHAPRAGSVGLPCGIEAKVVNAEGQALAVNDDGEIWLRGRHVAQGYYRDLARSAETFDAQGWVHTGDRGHVDNEGYYHITGRIKELIIKGGENIAPREIEEVIVQHPAINDVAAFAIPDEFYGQNIAVALVWDHHSTPWDEGLFRQWCQLALGAFKMPQRYHLLESIPRLGIGKVQRLQLAALLG
jgi:acyl-CoA synthetase (AMP-forming)/AMP-acid ligase II